MPKQLPAVGNGGSAVQSGWDVAEMCLTQQIICLHLGGGGGGDDNHSMNSVWHSAGGRRKEKEKLFPSFLSGLVCVSAGLFSAQGLGAQSPLQQNPRAWWGWGGSCWAGKHC